ncbi:hypothetical protein Btru_063312 [Bulinus truncatus]|nr:hypothetical protein Btru_063312 [Bulinus truncatus]
MPDILEDASPSTFIAKIACGTAGCSCSTVDFQALFQLTYVSPGTYNLELRGGQLSDASYILNFLCGNDTKPVTIFVKKNYPPIISSGNNGYG